MKKPTKILTAAAFIEAILNAPMKGNISRLFQGETIGVEGHVDLPRTVTRLPKNILFLGSLRVSQSSLREFNHVVLDCCLFDRCPQLERIGPKAVFHGTLGIGSCPKLKYFNSRVDGPCLFLRRSPSGVERFGPKCRFGSILEAGGTRIRSFNHTVKRFADFRGNRTLKRIGPKARFGGVVYLRGTPIGARCR